MSEKPTVLFVDDEPDVLRGMKLTLRKQYRVMTAESGLEGLELLGCADNAAIEVVVSDMRMPHMDGATFLSEVRRRHPHLPRILLTGQADMESAIAAVNDAKIFRFLTKPCPPEVLQETIDDAVEQARLRGVEQRLLDETLSAAVAVMTDVLGLVSAGAYSRTMRITELVGGLAAELDTEADWELLLAARLSQIGCVVISDDATPGELDGRHARVASELVATIPRLEQVADIVSHQLDPAPVAGSDPSSPADPSTKAELLRVAVGFDRLVAAGSTRKEAIQQLAAAPEPPARVMLDALSRVRPDREAMVEIETTVAQLAAGMQLTEDVVAGHGVKLAGAGVVLTSALIGRFRTFASSHGIAEPITVLAPASTVRELSTR
ncbi:MAG: response regulator [Actinomycetota bacterium]